MHFDENDAKGILSSFLEALRRYATILKKRLDHSRVDFLFVEHARNYQNVLSMSTTFSILLEFPLEYKSSRPVEVEFNLKSKATREKKKNNHY